MMQQAPSDWFVVWTESRAEKKVDGRLAALGLEHWLPLVTERHRWSDRWREVEVPLFPGYLFARTGVVEWNRVLRTPGVLTVVKHDHAPALLRDDFVQGLRSAIERGVHGAVELERVDELVSYDVGDEVIVRDGPLGGARGVVRELRGNRQLVIWVKAIGRGVAFTIGTAAVRKAEGL
jgi:transcription antitermination factor NusG